MLRPGGTFVVWGAREDDEELGLTGLSAYELNRLFAPRGFGRAEAVPSILSARSGALEACRFVLRSRGASRETG